MSQALPTNVAASVKQRLLNRARERKEDFNLLLTKYGLERMLYRVSQSKYRNLFVLKGALLFELWTEHDIAQREMPTSFQAARIVQNATSRFFKRFVIWMWMMMEFASTEAP